MNFFEKRKKEIIGTITTYKTVKQLSLLHQYKLKKSAVKYVPPAKKNLKKIYNLQQIYNLILPL